MPAKEIDGKALADSILAETKKLAAGLKLRATNPSLAVILVGSSPASELYVEKKRQACGEAGIGFDLFRFKETVSEKEVLSLIAELNPKFGVHGILVQLPLPKSLNRNRVLNSVSPLKDVDGFTSFNIGLLSHGIEDIVSCTALGILKLIESTGSKIEGSNVCIVNHSIVVGRPLAQLMLNRNATVTICNQYTRNLAAFTSKADILVTAVGKAGLITADMVKAGAVVIDAGILRHRGKTFGDVDFEAVYQKASFITPVPGGVGPVTVACLLHNLVKLASLQRT